MIYCKVVVATFNIQIVYLKIRITHSLSVLDRICLFKEKSIMKD